MRERVGEGGERCDDGLIGAARALLQARRRAVYAELAGYPPSITGCDLHYRQLAAERAGLARALDRLARPAVTGGDGMAALRAAIADAGPVDPAVRRGLADLLALQCASGRSADR